ncbi:putative ABC transporter substrate-binding protein [Gammaproteobacteria bacterium]
MNMNLYRVFAAILFFLPLFPLLPLTASADWLDVDHNPHGLMPSANSVNLGILVDYVGYSSFGPALLRGISMAAQEINAAGGVNGHPLALIVRDSMGIGALGAIQARQLVDQGVVAIAGIGFSSVAVAACPVVAASQTPLIGATTTSAAITYLDDHDTIYRMVPSDSTLGQALSEMIIRDGVKRLGILVRADAFSQGFAKSLRTLFPDAEAGRSLVSLVTYPEDKLVGFSAEVSQLLGPGNSNQLDGIAIIGISNELFNVTQDLANHAPTGIKYYTPRTGPELLTNGVREILLGMGAVRRAENPNTVANLTHFQERYATFYGITLEAAQDSKNPLSAGSSIQTYDSIYLLALAMAQAGENSREAILGNLRRISGGAGSPQDAVTIRDGEYARALEIIAAGGVVRYEGAIGPTRFDENGDISVFGYQEVRIEADATGKLISVAKEVHVIGEP